MQSAKTHLQQSVAAKTAFPGLDDAKALLAKM